MADFDVIDRPDFREQTSLLVRRSGTFLAVAGGGIGALVILGYVARLAWVVRISGSLPPMYPNAALGLLCGAVAVLVSQRRGVWRILGAVGTVGIGGIGAISLGLHIGGAKRTWFEGLFPDDFVKATTPIGGRPAAETCLAFVLLAVALTSLLLHRAPVVGQTCAIAGASVGLSAIVGYALGVDRSNLGGHLVYAGMALHTAVGIALIGLAAICVRPNVGIVAQMLDGGIAGGVSRRITLVVAMAPLGLLIAGALIGKLLTDDLLSQSVFSVLQVAVLSAAVLIPTAVVGRIETQLRQELDASRRRAEHQGAVDTLVEAVTAEMTITAPKLANWEIGMAYQPASGHLAGDSVQVHVRDKPDSATLVAVVDVAGHDIYSAVVAYGLRAHIGALWEMGVDIQTIVSNTNAKLLRRNTIATAVFVIFQPDATQLRVVNAGHPAPIHLRSGNHNLLRWTRTGPLLGISGSAHEVSVFEVESDDLIVLYTDGVIEARSPDGHEIGEEIIHRLIASHRHEPVARIADACVNAAVEHTQSRLRDDALVIAARRVH